jgi:D-alanyl-D-alanine carboxypeptidase
VPYAAVLYEECISTALQLYATLRQDPKNHLITYTGVKTGSMYKKPPDEERTSEYPDIIYPAQRRKRQASNYKPSSHKQHSSTFHEDEHPEIPRVRRASLSFDKQPTNPSPGSDLIQDVVDEEDIISQNITRTDKIKVKAKQRSSSSNVYSPPSRSRQLHRANSPAGSRHPRSQNLFLARMQQLSQSRIFIICCITTLLIVISAQIFVNLNYNHTAITLIPWGNTQIKQQPTTGQIPANAHKLVIIPQDTDHPAPPVLATSAYLLDADTGTTVYAYNPFMRLPMLSTTKLMTASLAVESGNLDQKITITNTISSDISQLSADSALFGIKKGETYSLRELLYGLLLVSGNDAAIAIADALGGNQQNFVAQMNQKAYHLGMYDTHFVNPHGLLDSGQYSCAHDLAILGQYSMSLPLLHKISGQISYHIPTGGNHPERFLINENQFMWWYPGVDGGKTGYDGQKDFIQVISVTRNNHHLIGVVMHTNNWWTDMRDLMNWGFDSFTWISPRNVDLNQHPIPYDNLWNYFARDTQTVTIPTVDKGRYYVYSGFSISGPIMTYFDKNGGLAKFGFPTKMPAAAVASITSQQFEHATIQCNLATGLCQTI